MSAYDYADNAMMKEAFLPTLQEAVEHVEESRGVSLPPDQHKMLLRGLQVTLETYSNLPSPCMKAAFKLAEFVNYTARGEKKPQNPSHS